MAKILREDTKALIDALQAVSAQAGHIANALMLKQMPPAKQHEYANLLRSLSEALHEHADLPETLREYADKEEEIAETTECEN